MPALADITINDGKTTPAAHTYGADNSQKATNAADWSEKVASIPTGWPTLSMGVFRSQDGKAAHRVAINQTEPIVGVVDGRDQVIRQSKSQLTLWFAPDSTPQEREDQLVKLANFVLLAANRTNVRNLTPWF